MDFNREVKNSFESDGSTFPARILASHVGMRGVQVGAGVGLIMAPVMMHLKKIPLKEAWLRTVPFYSITGAAAVLGYTFYRHLEDTEGVDRRAHALKYNQCQNKVDKYSAIGGLAGATLGALAGRNLRSILATSFTAMGVGVAVYAAEKEYNERKDSL